MKPAINDSFGLICVLGALRFMRKLIALKDDLYNRYIIKGNLFAPVIDAFIRNNGRYNLLDSAVLEMFEFIKLVSWVESDLPWFRQGRRSVTHLVSASGGHKDIAVAHS
jgi:hypothetical protein